MAMNIAEVIQRAREDAGNLHTKDVADEVLERHAVDGVAECSKYVPNRSMYSVILAEDVQSYSPEAGIISILDVFPFTTTTMADIFGEEFDVLIGRDLLYEWELIQYDKLMRYLNREQTRENFDWDYRPDGKLYIMPPPTVSQVGEKLYYIGVKDWTIATLPAVLVKLVVKYTTAQALIIAGRWRTRVVSPTRTGGAQDYGLYDPLLRDGKALMKEWRDDMETESARWFWK